MLTFQRTFENRSNDKFNMCYQHAGLEFKKYHNITFMVVELLGIDEVKIIANTPEMISFNGVELSVAKTNSSLSETTIQSVQAIKTLW